MATGRWWRGRVVAVVLCGLLAAACADAGGSEQAPADDATVSGDPAAASVGLTGEVEADDSDSASSETGTADEPTTAPTAPADGSASQASDGVESSPPPASESDPDGEAASGEGEPISLEAEVDPVCVRQGEVMHLTVRTEPDHPVIYSAVYAGEEGGGPPPYGSGHGGNDGGNTDDEGVYRSQWTVSPSAPVGDARVEIFTSRTDGSGQTAQIAVPFEVRSAAALSC